MSAADAGTSQDSVKISSEAVSFSFGQNWRKYVSGLNESNVQDAINNFCDFTQLSHLNGETFIDLGCGSGLSSLVAYRLGAKTIFSLDVDLDSVQCTKELRDRLAPEARNWNVVQGSVLDAECLRSLGHFSYVYCWGVVHHTGAMWRALENVAQCVGPSGRLHTAIYNEHRNSAKWLQIKRLCNKYPTTIFPVLKLALAMYVCAHLLYEGQSPVKYLREYSKKRGMKFWRDIEDWLGGLPYEYCNPDEAVDFLTRRGFALVRVKTTTFIGCNEFLFQAR
jgi:SAM-dependent methyltransferase